MAISFVGSKTFTHAATSAQSVSLTDLKDTANADVAPAIGDYVVVTYILSTNATNRTAAEMTPTGYTAAHTDLFADDSNDCNMLVCYKKLTAADTTVSIPASSATTAGCAVEIRALRGVDATTPLDVTPTTATAINTGVANAPAITPASPGALITVHGGAAVAAGVVFTNPSGLSATTNHFRSATITTTTTDANVGVGMKTDWASGAFDPAVFGGSTSTNTGSWAAVTIAWRPQLDPVLAGGAIVEDDDTTTSTGVTPDYAAASIVEADDVANGAFTVADPVAALVASIIEADDTTTSAAVTPDRAVASIVEADDTTTSAAVTPDRAVASIVEASDTTTSAVVVPARGLASIVEADDTASGAVVTPAHGAASIIEASDTTTSAVVTPDKATASIVEADDTTSGAAAVPDYASGAIVEADDIAVGAVGIPAHGVASIVEDSDQATGAAVTPDRAVASIVEADDIAAGTIAEPAEPLFAAASITEGDDIASGAVAVPVRGESTIQEDNDNTITPVGWLIAPQNVALATPRNRMAEVNPRTRSGSDGFNRTRTVLGSARNRIAKAS